jgi:hypothetical protein
MAATSWRWVLVGVVCEVVVLAVVLGLVWVSVLWVLCFKGHLMEVGAGWQEWRVWWLAVIVLVLVFLLWVRGG